MATKAPATNLHNIFFTASKLEEEGAWVTVNPVIGLKIKVRRMRSDFATAAYEKLVREQFGEGKLRRPEDINESASLDILKQHLAQTILCDWVNVVDADGNDVPYSVEMAREFMEMRDFREFVLQAANERDTFKEQADEEAEGN